MIHFLLKTIILKKTSHELLPSQKLEENLWISSSTCNVLRRGNNVGKKLTKVWTKLPAFFLSKSNNSTDS